MGQLTAPAVIQIGTVVAAGTPGSVLFIGAGGLLAQDNANLFFNNGTGGTQELLIGTTTPLNAPNYNGVRVNGPAGTGGFYDVLVNNVRSGSIYVTGLTFGITEVSNARNLFLGVGNLAVSWQISTSPNGILRPGVDNTQDIGGTGVFRPRSLFIGTSVQIEANNGLRLTNQVDGAAAGAGTLLNAPAGGDPTFWMPITVNGANKHIPCW